MPMMLFDGQGQLKHLTSSEQAQFEEAALAADGKTASFCLMLLYSGCRISEAMNLQVQHIDFEAQAVVFETLKQRKGGVFRLVPLPDIYLGVGEK